MGAPRRRAIKASVRGHSLRELSGTALLSERNRGRRLASFWPESTIVEHEMTKHIVQLPNPDGSLLLRELNHRIRNELTCAIYAVSAKAVQSEIVAVKTTLLHFV